MYTVKEVSEITGLSIRTLRYYDEIGLLKPTQLTESGYRLYDKKSIEKIQQIMFFRELEVPLMDIKLIMNNPDYDKKQVLLTQKSILEHKRNRLNGLIELINDVIKGGNTMSFEAFDEKEIQEIIDHTLESMKKEVLEKQVELYGNGDIEKYREHIAASLKNEKNMAYFIKWYGCKEKALEAMLSSNNDEITLSPKDENDRIYKQFVQAKEAGDLSLEKKAVENLGEFYKTMLNFGNARAFLLDLVKELRESEKLADFLNTQYGDGIAEYIALAIERYYGE